MAKDTQNTRSGDAWEPDFTRSVARQITRDFQLAGLDIEVMAGEVPAVDRVRVQVEQAVAHLMETDHHALLNMLYRIDVSESRLAAAIGLESLGEATPTIAGLIMERASQKVTLRQSFGSPVSPENPLDRLEDWK
ncbi:MAG: hypothetical protein AAGB22_02775 [Bacteroidota bacterium]